MAKTKSDEQPSAKPKPIRWRNWFDSFMRKIENPKAPYWRGKRKQWPTRH